MSSPITKRLKAYLIVGPGACLEFPVTFEYDRRDPYAVRLAFPPTRHPARPDPDPDRESDILSWTFGRELIAEGLHGTAGAGDVHVWPCGLETVMLELRVDTGSAMLAVPSRELRTFLFLSYAEVPPGYESRYLELDQALHDLMGRA
jgi:hypothetical protein